MVVPLENVLQWLVVERQEVPSFGIFPVTLVGPVDDVTGPLARCPTHLIFHGQLKY